MKRLASVLVGDSVAAGEGIDYGWHWSGSSWAPNTSGPNTPWLDPTRGLGGNYQSCHESPWAYPQLVSQDNAFNMTESACTGAGSLSGLLNSESVTNPDTSTTDNVPPQVGGSCTDCGLPNYLASQNSDPNSPTLYTLTVGADDIDFANWISQCYAGVTACNTDANSSTLNEQISQAKSHLEEVLDVVDSQNSSALYTPLVLVTGYYDPIPSPTSNASCTDTSTSTWVGITTDENNWLQDGLSNLNIAISQAVTYAQTAEAHIQVEFVDLSTAFAGHEFCSTDPWAYGPSIQYNLGTAYANNPAPFHPTPEGQRAIATAVEAAITSARTGGWVG